jgi:hypothetical protein
MRIVRLAWSGCTERRKRKTIVLVKICRHGANQQNNAGL